MEVGMVDDMEKVGAELDTALTITRAGTLWSIWLRSTFDGRALEGLL